MGKTKIETRGRKPIDKAMQKIAIQLYLERYKVENIGGIDKAKEILTNHLSKLNDDKEKTN
jgi:hypothetical protein